MLKSLCWVPKSELGFEYKLFCHDWPVKCQLFLISQLSERDNQNIFLVICLPGFHNKDFAAASQTLLARVRLCLWHNTANRLQFDHTMSQTVMIYIKKEICYYNPQIKWWQSVFSRGSLFTGEILVLWINGCNLQCVQEVVNKHRNLTSSVVNKVVFSVICSGMGMG